MEVLLARAHRLEMLHVSASNRIASNVVGRFGKMLSINFVLKSINHTEKKKFSIKTFKSFQVLSRVVIRNYLGNRRVITVS